MKSLLEKDKRAGLVDTKAKLINWLLTFNDRYWDEGMQNELNKHIIGENGVDGYLSRLKG